MEKLENECHALLFDRAAEIATAKAKGLILV